MNKIKKMFNTLGIPLTILRQPMCDKYRSVIVQLTKTEEDLCFIEKITKETRNDILYICTTTRYGLSELKEYVLTNRELPKQ